MRSPGNSETLLMALSGHRTNSVFRRYDMTTEEEDLRGRSSALMLTALAGPPSAISRP
jgi:hypothetical protein